jgi:hypothetical protein
MQGQELAPDILPAFCRTGCYGVKGPVPSAVLDKFNLDQTSFCSDKLSSSFPRTAGVPGQALTSVVVTDAIASPFLRIV